jgi:hypothetical protein
LRVAEHRLDPGAAQGLDAAGRIDLLDRHGCPDPALLAGIGQGAGNRVQHAEFHPRALGAQHGWRGKFGRRNGGPQGARLQETAAREAC